MESLVADAGVATDSSRFRYLQWYEEGLEALRRNLLEVASQRAAELGRSIDGKAEAGTGR